MAIKIIFIAIIITLSMLGCTTDCLAAPQYTTQAVSNRQPRQGTVNRDGVAGAISKEADKLFTQYANNNDTDGITMMLLEGQLVHLPKGERVVLIEYGVATHKIRTKKGQILYVAREHITLDNK